MNLYKKQISIMQASFVTGLNRNVILKAVDRGLVDDFYIRGRHHINLGDLREFCFNLHNGSIRGVSPLIRLYPMATIDKFIMLFIYKLDYTDTHIKRGGEKC